jgi:hypothetical protein
MITKYQTKKVKTKKTLKELIKEKRELNKCFKYIEVTMYCHDKIKNTHKNFDKLVEDEINFYNHLTNSEKIEHNRIRLSILVNQLEFIRSSIDLRNFEFLRNFNKNNNITFIKNCDDEIKIINKIIDLRKKQTELITRVKDKPLSKIQRQINKIKKENSINV